jgi:hypothetical protein
MYCIRYASEDDIVVDVVGVVKAPQGTIRSGGVQQNRDNSCAGGTEELIYAGGRKGEVFTAGSSTI